MRAQSSFAMNTLIKIAKKSGGLLFILLLALSLYFRVGSYDFVNWDDNLYISQNALVNGQEGIAKIFTQSFEGHYHPLVLLTLRQDYSLGSGSPAIFHFHNILLHLLNILLMWLMLKRLFPDSLVPFWITLLFAIHPVQIEAVAWATARKDVQYGFWFLLSLNAWLAFRFSQKKWIYILSILFFCFACLSKAQAVMLAPLLVLIDYFHYGIDSRRKRNLTYLPFFILAALFGALAIWAQEQSGYTAAATFTIPISEMAANASLALLLYIYRLVWPIHLSAYYPIPLAGIDIPEVLFWLAIPVAMFVFYLAFRWSLKKDRKGFGMLWFLILIFPMLRLVPVSNYITADRYTYLAGTGFFIAVCFVFGSNREKLRNLLFLILSVAFTFLSFERIPVWKNSSVLLNNILEHHPNVVPALNARGDVYVEEGKINLAITDFTKAIALRPEDARGWRNRGLAYALNSQWENALIDLTHSLELQPKHIGTRINRSRVYSLANDTQSAIKDLNVILEENPDYHLAYARRAELFLRVNEPKNAAADLETALQLSPGRTEYLAIYATALTELNEFNKALALIEEAHRKGYNHPRLNIVYGQCLLELGQANEGSSVLENVVLTFPTSSDAWQLLCRAYLVMNEYAKAEEAAGKLLDLVSGNGEAFYLRGMARLSLLKREEACRDLEAAFLLGHKDAEMLIEENCR